MPCGKSDLAEVVEIWEDSNEIHPLGCNAGVFRREWVDGDRWAEMQSLPRILFSLKWKSNGPKDNIPKEACLKPWSEAPAASKLPGHLLGLFTAFFIVACMHRQVCVCVHAVRLWAFCRQEIFLTRHFICAPWFDFWNILNTLIAVEAVFSFNAYLFIWLPWILVRAHRTFFALSCGIFLAEHRLSRCGTRVWYLPHGGLVTLWFVGS